MLAIELAGGRLLTPLFGQSLELWSILITVTLGGLALGYGAGSRLARQPTTRHLAILFAIAAAACFLIALWGARLLGPLSREPGTARLFLAAGLAVFPSMIALGAVGPVLVSIVGNGTAAGVSAGRVFAVSTVGSLLAGPTTGLLLLPTHGVRAVFMLTGGVLLLVSLALLPSRLRRVSLLLYLALLLLTTSSHVSGTSTHYAHTVPGVGFHARYRSPHGQVLVLETVGLAGAGRPRRRVLLVDGHIQNAIDAQTGEGPPNSYQQAVAALVPLQPGDRAVVLGLGAGLLPMHWARQGVQVIAAEPNPAVTEAAHAYFGLRRHLLDVRGVDGRRVVRALPAPADVVVVDAFVGATVPGHLLTREAMREAVAALTPDGVWVAWVLDFPGVERGAVWPRVARTARAVFADVRVYRHASDGPLGGYFIVGRGTGGRTLGDAPGFQLVEREVVDRRTAAVPVQTDDRWDLDRFGGRLNALAHAEVRAHLTPDLHRWLID